MHATTSVKTSAADEKKRLKEEKKSRKAEEKRLKGEEKQAKKLEKQLLGDGGGLFSRWKKKKTEVGTPVQNGAAANAGPPPVASEEPNVRLTNDGTSTSNHNPEATVAKGKETYLDVVPHGVTGNSKDGRLHDSGIVVEGDDENHGLVFRGHTSASQPESTPLLRSSLDTPRRKWCCRCC